MEIERICNAVDDNIMETAAIGVPPPGGGPETLVIAVVFKDPGSSPTNLNTLVQSFNSALQRKLNPLFKVRVQKWRRNRLYMKFGKCSSCHLN